MARVTWYSPYSGESLSVNAGSASSFTVWCEPYDSRGYLCRIKLTSNNSKIKFANNAQTYYTSSVENKDEIYEKVYVTGVSAGTATITLSMEWSLDGSSWSDSRVDTQTLSVTVSSGSVVTCPFYVNINGTWKQCTAAYVNVNGTWKQVSESKANINGTWK